MTTVAPRWALPPLLMSVALAHGTAAQVAVLEDTRPGQVAILEDLWPSEASCGVVRDSIRVEALDEATFVLRESACLSREAPFLYLLLGSERALLVDSGTQDGASLTAVVSRKLTEVGLSFADLTVVHTHSHRDHRGGDRMLAEAGASVVGPTLEEVRTFWNLEAWPEGVASLNLGNRLIEVIAIPGHNDNSIALFDHGARILLSGDSMIRGKINITDLTAFRISVARLSGFISHVSPPVVLGGHLERSNVPLGLAPSMATELAEMSERVGFVRPFIRGDDFTLVYLRPVFAAMGVGILLVFGRLFRALVVAYRRRRPSMEVQ